ncbi:MAG: cytochrome c biogenesis protein CcsA [Acidobacteriaceae bacterium]|nr:cytochrome c biogenesis protein CcsA [Acidobacteriaceae bacterium]
MHLLWLRVAAVLYAAASVAIFPAVLHPSERWRSSAVHLGGLAFLFHFISCVEMLVQAHRWMPVGAREAESLLGFLITGLFFLAWWLYDALSLGIFALPCTLFLVFVPALGVEGYTFPSQGVRNSWLVAHIAALLAAYAGLGFSLLASVLYLVQEKRLKAKMKGSAESRRAVLDWLPPLDSLERLAHAMLLFGFPCMTVGLLLGAVLVQETSLGAAYFLDPKVLASFGLWVLYVLLLFLRHTAGLRGRRAAYLSGAVLVLMLCVWAANMISHVHRFGAL